MSLAISLGDCHTQSRVKTWVYGSSFRDMTYTVYYIDKYKYSTSTVNLGISGMMLAILLVSVQYTLQQTVLIAKI